MYREMRSPWLLFWVITTPSADAMNGRVHMRAALPLVLRASPAMNLFSDLARSISKSLQEVSVQHILVPTQLDANEIYNALVAGEAGVSSQRFGEVAAARSTCGSAKKKPDAMLAQLRGQPGELHFRRGSMAPEFEKVAFAAPIGKLQRPIKTQFGWHIILVNERTGEEGKRVTYER